MTEDRARALEAVVEAARGVHVAHTRCQHCNDLYSALAALDALDTEREVQELAQEAHDIVLPSLTGCVADEGWKRLARWHRENFTRRAKE